MNLRLYLDAAATQARRSLAYRVDFWVEAAVVFFVSLGVAWSLWTAVFDATGATRIGGFDRPGMILYVVTVLLAAKLVRGADLGDAAVSSDVFEGGLTRYLLYPASYRGLKYAEHVGGLAPAFVQLVLFGAPFLLLLSTPEAPVSLGSLAMGAVSLMVANLLCWLLLFPFHCVAFWAEGVWTLVLAVRFVGDLLGGVMIPLGAFPAWTQPWHAALPLRHLYAEPVETLLGRRDVAAWGADLAAAGAWCLALAVVGQATFLAGRRRYTGPGI